ncbi:MAG: DNA-processing protein DprA [Desulfovibrionaceae bacterium]|nr:DNA-processing protein DprA [Desulfovibrionaceae bacterium]
MTAHRAALHTGALGQSAAWQRYDEAMRRQFWATLALRHTQGLGVRSVARLLHHYGTAYAAVQAAGQWRRVLGLRESVVAAFCSGSWRVTAEQEWRRAQSLDAHIVLWHDACYPTALRQLPDAPALLYCRGALSLLSGALLGMVGSRHCSAQGLRLCAGMAGDLAASGLTIVSGMAKGIDSAAHSAALDKVGSSIGVLGTGIDCVYPPAHEALHSAMARHGLLLSEFAPGTQAHPSNFPVRNRIISGLSLGVVIVEAAFKSGSLITARLALEQNREVYIVPAAHQHTAFSEGCRALALEGAQVVDNAEQILCDLAPHLSACCPAPKPAQPLTSTAPSAHSAAASKPQAAPLVPAVHIQEGLALPARHSSGAELEPQINHNTRADLLPPATRSAAVAAPFFEQNKPNAAPEQAKARPQPTAQAALKPTATAVPAPLAALPALAAQLYHSIAAHPECTVDALCEQLSCGAGQANAQLVVLEMEGCVHRLPGGRYRAGG